MISTNQQKYLTSLHLKKFRQKYRNFLVEGEKMVKELLSQHRVEVVQVYGTERWASANAALLAPFYDKFNTVTEADLKKCGTLTTPNQVLAVAAMPAVPALEGIVVKPLILYLDGIQDPGNMGTILRIADWFGIGTVCCAPDTVDCFSPKVIQAGMGACLRVQVCEDMPLADLATVFPNVPVIGAVMDGENLYKTHFPSSGILVIGNEGKGIRAGNEAMLTHRITIPGGTTGSGAESLNAGVATGIIVSEVLRPR